MLGSRSRTRRWEEGTKGKRPIWKGGGGSNPPWPRRGNSSGHGKTPAAPDEKERDMTKKASRRSTTLAGGLCYGCLRSNPHPGARSLWRSPAGQTRRGCERWRCERKEGGGRPRTEGGQVARLPLPYLKDDEALPEPQRASEEKERRFESRFFVGVNAPYGIDLLGTDEGAGQPRPSRPEDEGRKTKCSPR